MAEVNCGPYAHNPGYNGFHLTIEVYRLFSCVAASQALSKRIKSDKENDHVWNVLKEAEFSEVCRILIGLAAVSRNSLDAGYNTELEASVVGEWVTNLKRPKPKPLPFREACHKVLHARAMQPDVIAPKGKPPSMAHPLSHLVYLYGEHRGEGWRATVDLFAFAAMSYKVC